MAAQAFTSGAASAAGSNLVNAVFATPQGQAVVGTTAAIVVAAAPVVLIVAAAGAVGAGVGYGVGSFIEWLNS